MLYLSAAVGDVGANDALACQIDWGDGGVAAGTLAKGMCSGSHAYASIGVPTVTVTVTDDDGGSGTDQVPLVLKAGSLSFWKWKLGQERIRKRAAGRAEPVRLIELRAEPAAGPLAQPFDVELRSGRRVRVTAGFDAAELARLVVVLEEARP